MSDILVNTLSDDNLKFMIKCINGRISEEMRTIPIFYKWMYITQSKESMIHFVQYLIDMRVFETSDKLKQKFKNIYDHLNEMIEKIKSEDLIINEINISDTLLRLPFGIPIDSKNYQMIMDQLSKYPDCDYEKYYSFDEAYVGDYVFIYRYTCYTYEITDNLYDEKIQKKWQGIKPEAIYRVKF